MSRYCFIASRDPVTSADTQQLYRRAGALAEGGAEVSIYLVQNGVLGSRPMANGPLKHAHELGVRIFADDFSLRERGITAGEMRPFVEPLSVDQWVRHVMSEQASRLIWH